MTSGFVSAVCVAALAVACGGSTAVTEITGPSGDAARCQTAVSASSRSLPASGGSVTASVTAARECSWSATSDASWIQVTPSSGQGQGSLTVTVAANPAPQSRSAAVVVNDQRLNLSQEPAPCQYQVGDTPRLSHTGGRATISVSTTDGCEWAVSSTAEWVRVVTTRGSGTGTVQLDVAANNSAVTRTGTLSVAGHTRTVIQDGRPNSPTPPQDPEPPQPPACSPSIEPGERSFGPGGGEGSFHVRAADGCRWNATVDVPWITVPGATQTGTRNVDYTVGRNTSTDSRTGIITVAGRTHVVRQEGERDDRDDDDDDDSDDDNDDNEGRVEVSGSAWAVTGSCPQKAFAVGAQRIFTDGGTKFKGGNCENIANGTELEVKGRRNGGWLRADEVRIRDD